MTNLVEAIANNSVVVVTFNYPEEDQNHGTATIEALTGDLPPAKHGIQIDEQFVFHNGFTVEDGQPISLDSLPHELAVHLLEDFPELMAAYLVR